MTELIVALDGPKPLTTLIELYDKAGVRWFKVGPQTMMAPAESNCEFQMVLQAARWNMRPLADVKIFLDLKLADTEDTVYEAVKRFAEARIAAVSTFTDEATEAAQGGAADTNLKVWRVLRLTDQSHNILPVRCIGDGVICSVNDFHEYVTFSSDIDKVCPGIRRSGDLANNHKRPATAQEAVAAGATHIVVGRPIWQAPDPVAAAKEFLAALEGSRAQMRTQSRSERDSERHPNTRCRAVCLNRISMV